MQEKGSTPLPPQGKEMTGLAMGEGTESQCLPTLLPGHAATQLAQEMQHGAMTNAAAYRCNRSRMRWTSHRTAFLTHTAVPRIHKPHD